MVEKEEAKDPPKSADTAEEVKPRSASKRLDPAYVPTAGGFFLHDDRFAEGSSSSRGGRSARGRGGKKSVTFHIACGFGLSLFNAFNINW